jgi:hypothetical protein
VSTALSKRASRLVLLLTALAALPLPPRSLPGQRAGLPRADSIALEKVTLADGIYLFRAP